MADATSPDAELKKLEESLAANQKDAERLKAAIGEQKKLAGDVDQKEKDFAKVSDDTAKKKKKDLDDFVALEEALLEATGDKQPVKDLKDKARADLDALSANVTAAKADVTAKEAALDNAKKSTAAKQSDFGKITDIPSKNAAVLKDAASLVDKGNAEGKANNFSRMYFIVLVLKDRLAQFDPITPDAYAKNLNQRAADLTAAQNAERTAKEDLDKANADLKEAQKAFDARKATWVDDALKSIAPGGTSGVADQPDAAEAAPEPEPEPTPTPVTPTSTGGSEAAQPA